MRRNGSGLPGRCPAPLRTLEAQVGPSFPVENCRLRRPPGGRACPGGGLMRSKQICSPYPSHLAFSVSAPGEPPPPHSILGSLQRLLVYREGLVALSRVGELLLLFGCSVVSVFATPWTVAHQASLSFTISQSLLKLISTESVMRSSQFIFYHPFLRLPQTFPASGSFPVSQLFASGGQSIGASASASVLPMNIQG